MGKNSRVKLMKKEIVIKHVSDYIEGNLQQVIDNLQALQEKYGGMHPRIELQYEYDHAYHVLTIERFETDAEYELRLKQAAKTTAKEKKEKEKRKEQRRKLYEKLRKEFET